MKLIEMMVICSLLFSTISYAECNMASDINIVDDGVLYSNDCHRKVGKIFKENKDLKTLRDSYEQLVTVQKDRIQLELDRAELWKNTSLEMEERIQNLDKLKKYNDFIYFGAGVLMTLGAAWAVGQASK